MGVDVFLPVELPDDEVEIVVLLFRHVLDEQAPRHRPSLDERLKHCEHVAAPLWLIGEQRARSVQDARRDQPACATLEPVGLGEVDDTVVATVPVLQALPHVLLRGARLQPHERVGKVVVAVVVLRREVIALRFAFLADELGILERLVHVMGDRPHVVEELRVDGPLLVAVPDLLADELRGPLADGITQEEPLAVEHAPRQSLVGHAALGGGFGRAGEPPLVDAATVEAVGVVVVGVEADPLAGMEEAPRHPGGRQPEDSLAGGERPVERGADILRLGKLGGGAGSGGGGHGKPLSWTHGT